MTSSTFTDEILSLGSPHQPRPPGLIDTLDLVVEASSLLALQGVRNNLFDSLEPLPRIETNALVAKSNIMKRLSFVSMSCLTHPFITLSPQ